LSCIGYEGSTKQLEDDAKGILSLIWNCYPGHDWYVRCLPGVIFIRDLGLDAPLGMAIKVREFDFDAAVLKKKIIMSTGEWLERVGKMRGRKDGDQDIVRVEGMPKHWEKFQPIQQPAKTVEVAPENGLREEVRPQVAELLKNGN
jgi:hypothetical protein